MPKAHNIEVSTGKPKKILHSKDDFRKSSLPLENYLADFPLSPDGDHHHGVRVGHDEHRQNILKHHHRLNGQQLQILQRVFRNMSYLSFPFWGVAGCVD